jgi:N-hydroxyarylamine O-acetyltransferase
MENFNKLFRARIGFPENEPVTIYSLSEILQKTAKTIPFENLAILNKSYKDITKENLMEKILTKNEGGVCYDINTTLYYFLIENGFEVTLLRGQVFIPTVKNWSPTGRTHVIVLLTHDGVRYIVDSGFGLNLSLNPVPLNGGVVSSETGVFRIRRTDSEDGDYVMEMRLKGRDHDWVTGYKFDLDDEISGKSELNQVQRIIVESPHSPFNKAPLLTKITDRGNIVLTENSLTVRIDGNEAKTVINKQQFLQLKKKHFGF